MHTYGVAGNLRALLRVHRAVEHYWQQNVEKQEMARYGPSGAISADQGTVPVASPKLHYSCQELQAGYRHTVNRRPKSPVREICTLGSVEAGGG